MRVRPAVPGRTAVHRPHHRAVSAVGGAGAEVGDERAGVQLPGGAGPGGGAYHSAGAVRRAPARFGIFPARHRPTMTPLAIERVFGRDRLKMVTGRYVEVFREAAASGERRRYTKRFLSGADGDYTQWTGREWRLLARLVGHGVRHVPEIVLFDRGQSDSAALVQTYDAGVTVDHWATLLPVRRDGQVLRHVFRDCAHWWALAENFLLALREIHQLQLVHLDIKADNVCIPLAPTLFNPHVPGELLFPAFEQLALIDFAFSLVSGERLDTPLPIGAQPEFAYQSPRLLHALSAGRQGDMRPTHELDWRCDMYSLAALLGRLLPPPERWREARHADGWSADRHIAAKALLLAIREAHDGEASGELPHDRLLASTRAVLRHPDMRDSLERGWTLAAGSNAIEALEPAAPPTPLTRVVEMPTVVEERVADDAQTSPARAGATAPALPLPGAVPVVEIELRAPTDLVPMQARSEAMPPAPPLPAAAPAAEVEPRAPIDPLPAQARTDAMPLPAAAPGAEIGPGAPSDAPLPVAVSAGPVAAPAGPVAASAGPVAAPAGPVAASAGPVAALPAAQAAARTDAPPAAASPPVPDDAAAATDSAARRGSANEASPSPAAAAVAIAAVDDASALPRGGEAAAAAAAPPRRRLGRPLGYAAAAVAAVGLLAVLAHVASPDRERTPSSVATTRPPPAGDPRAGAATAPRSVAAIRPPAGDAGTGAATVPGSRPEMPKAAPGTAPAGATPPPTAAASGAGEPVPQERRAPREVARLPGAAPSGTAAAVPPAAAPAW